MTEQNTEQTERNGELQTKRNTPRASRNRTEQTIIKAQTDTNLSAKTTTEKSKPKASKNEQYTFTEYTAHLLDVFVVQMTVLFCFVHPPCNRLLAANRLRLWKRAHASLYVYHIHTPSTRNIAQEAQSKRSKTNGRRARARGSESANGTAGWRVRGACERARSTRAT